MDFVHCNCCQVAPSSENKSFWFTNCMHIYCKKCVQKHGVPNTKEVMCVHCKKQCQVIEIGPNMPPKVKKLFTPIEQTIKQQAEIMNRVCKFQEDQLASMICFAKKEKDELSKAIKAYQALNSKAVTLAKDKAALYESVTYHKNRLVEFERNIKELQDSMKGGRRNAANPAVGSGLSFLMNGTAQSDPSDYNGMGNSMMSEANSSFNVSFVQDSSFNGFLNASEPSTPMCSQMSSGVMTTPKILGLPKKGIAAGVRSDNPYLEMWNRTSVERQKRATGGGGAARSKSSGSPMNWIGKK